MELIMGGIFVIGMTLLLFALYQYQLSQRDSLAEEEIGLEALIHDYCGVSIGYPLIRIPNNRISVYRKILVISSHEKIIIPGNKIVAVKLSKLFNRIEVLYLKDNVQEKLLIFPFFPEKLFFYIKELQVKNSEEK